MWQRGADGKIRRVAPSDAEGAGGRPANEAEAAELRPGSLSVARTLFRGIREAYDFLGSVLAMSALVAVVALPLGSGVFALVLWFQERSGVSAARSPGAAILLALVIVGALTGPLLAGCYGLARQIVGREDPGLGELFREARLRWRSGMALGALQTGVALVLLADAVFFASLRIAGLRWLSVVFIYAMLFWGLMGVYQWPLLVDDRAGGGSPPRLRAVVRKSALLVLDNFALSLVLGLVGLLFTIVCVATGAGLVLLWAGTLAFLQTTALRELWRKYGILPPEPDVPSEET
jgi:hypothetical protein